MSARKSRMIDSLESHIPPERKYYTRQGTLEQRCDWNALARSYAQKLKKIVRKNHHKDDLDTTDDMMKRRIRAIVDILPKVAERYRHVPGYEPEDVDEIGKSFIQLNFIPDTTYNHIDVQGYILLAASIWILDEILSTGDPEKRKQLFRLLPRDAEEIDRIWNAPDFWHTDYEDDLIISVQYILHCRNQDIEKTEVESDDTERILTSSLVARNAQHPGGPGREAYERLMALIPKESIDRAAAYFDELFWKWTDRYFDCLAYFNAEKHRCIDRANASVKQYNRLRQKLINLSQEMTRLRQAGAKLSQASAVNPLLMNPAPQMPDFLKKPDLISEISPRPGMPIQGVSQDTPGVQAVSIMKRMLDIADDQADALEEKTELGSREIEFDFDLLRTGCLLDRECREKYGDEIADRMKPLTVRKPFEVCFGLLWLIENGSDLPWMYGCGCGLMQEVVESLPWGIYAYKEIYDPVWNPEEEEEVEQLSFLDDVPRKTKGGKPSAIPEWYERKYVSREEEPFRFNRSMAQIVYEETGCILSRDMHRYDIRQKALKRYGVAGKDTTGLLMLFTALGHAKRSERALNLDQMLMEHWDDEDSDAEALPADGKENQAEERQLTYEELAGKLKDTQQENKKLRISLYEAEKSSREVRRELTAVQESAALEHRELADLREVIFNAENTETEAAEEAMIEHLFPYEVKKETVVFGGHETWLKAIKPMVTGRIRFLNKDLNFDANIIRKTDIIWIQTNAISHPQYYRITDAARQYKKTIRYFTHASATKGALQIMNADCEQGKHSEERP